MKGMYGTKIRTAGRLFWVYHRFWPQEKSCGFFIQYTIYQQHIREFKNLLPQLSDRAVRGAQRQNCTKSQVLKGYTSDNQRLFKK
jgi:hypothetical protein